MTSDEFGDPEIDTRISQYEMAFRMQSSVPGTDRSVEGAGQHVSTSTDPTRRSPAPSPPIVSWPAAWPSAACVSSSSIIAIGIITAIFPATCRSAARMTDQPSAALITDLKQRGMLDDTLVIWGGEFGRTVYCQGRLTADDYGRDHHPRCFTMWMAGGGIKPGVTLGETDDYCYNIAKDPVHVHDLQATILHCLGIDHTRLTYKFQGRHFRLTDVSRKGRDSGFRLGVPRAFRKKRNAGSFDKSSFRRVSKYQTENQEKKRTKKAQTLVGGYGLVDEVCRIASVAKLNPVRAELVIK